MLQSESDLPLVWGRSERLFGSCLLLITYFLNSNARSQFHNPLYGDSRRTRDPRRMASPQRRLRRCATELMTCRACHTAPTWVEGHARRSSEHPDARENCASSQKRPFRALPDESRSEHSVTESAVMASEIEVLPDRAGYLKFASEPVWMKVEFPVYDLRIAQKAFVAR